MTNFKRLNKKSNNYFINSRTRFIPMGSLAPELVKKVFDFAYKMTFEHKGEHRDHRTGGTHQRRNGEIFTNTFQGKLAEYALYSVLRNKDIHVSQPDLGVFGLGKWDSVDLTIENISLSIKSTKAFGNLLLLEEHDWDEQANYLPNRHGYDYTFLIRMNPFCEDLMKHNRFLYLDDIDKNKLSKIILSENWTFDIPGYVTRDDLIQIINEGYILPRGAMLNGKTKMDASNYYVQSGDMRSLQQFIDIIGKKK